jgi:two-component system, OmpR family, response regulator
MAGRPVVLVVEDDESVYELLSEFLAARGFSVFGAGRSDEAMALVAELHPQAVILDSLEGFVLTRRMRAIDPAHRTPILLVSGRVERRLEREAFTAGCDSFVRKPFHLDEIAGELKRLCTR